MRWLTVVSLLGLVYITKCQDSPPPANTITEDPSPGQPSGFTTVTVPSADTSIPIPTTDSTSDVSPTTDTTSSSSSSAIPTPTPSLPPVSGLNLRILPMGDSITEGYGSSNSTGYRGSILQQLLADNNNVTMIGSVTAGNISQPLCDGHLGAKIDEIANYAQVTLPQRPNVVFLHAGTNDAIKIPGNAATISLPAMSTLLDRIFSTCPDATVIMSQVIPLPAGTDAMQSTVQSLNTLYADLVTAQLALGRHIVHVKTKEAFVNANASLSSLYFEGFHPNNKGYQIMSQQFYQGLQQAVANGWVSDPVPTSNTLTKVQKTKWCYNLPVWTSQGQYFNGTGIGATPLPSSTCKPINNTLTCNCVFGDGTSIKTPLTGANCSSMGYSTIRPIQFADLTGDGTSDLVFLSPNGTASIYVNTGSGFTYATALNTTAGARREQVLFADIDGDGLADMTIVKPNGAVTVFLNKYSNGSFSWVNQGVVLNSIGVPGAGVRFFDVNGDGKADYCYVSDTGSVSCRVNQGLVNKKLTVVNLANVTAPIPGNNSTNTTTTPILNQVSPADLGNRTRDGVIMADLSGNLWSDFLFVDRKTGATSLWDAYRNSVAQYRSQGATVRSGLPLKPANVFFTDINGDGRADLVSVDPLTSAVSWWRNDCGLKFSSITKRALALTLA